MQCCNCIVRNLYAMKKRVWEKYTVVYIRYSSINRFYLYIVSQIQRKVTFIWLAYYSMKITISKPLPPSVYMFQVTSPDPTIPKSEYAHFSRPGSAYVIKPQSMHYSDNNMVGINNGGQRVVRAFKLALILFFQRWHQCMVSELLFLFRICIQKHKGHNNWQPLAPTGGA